MPGAGLGPAENTDKFTLFFFFFLKSLALNHSYKAERQAVNMQTTHLEVCQGDTTD